MKHLWWRVRLVYHWRRLGMSKRRWRALPAIWRLTDDPPYALRYEMGWSPLSVAMEEW
jgi:hypothetical protein